MVYSVHFTRIFFHSGCVVAAPGRRGAPAIPARRVTLHPVELLGYVTKILASFEKCRMPNAKCRMPNYIDK